MNASMTLKNLPGDITRSFLSYSGVGGRLSLLVIIRCSSAVRLFRDSWGRSLWHSISQRSVISGCFIQHSAASILPYFAFPL